MTITTMQPEKTPFQNREIRLFSTSKGNLDRIDGDEIIEELRNTKNKQSLKAYGYVTDLDGTLFCEDIGASLLFLKTLTPEFWNDTSFESFKATLITQDVNTVLSIAQASQPNTELGNLDNLIYISDLSKAANTIRTIIIPNILAVFTRIKTATNNNQPPDKQEILKFTYLMSILDKLIMKLEPICASSLNGRIIPKTRFLANKNKVQTNQIVDQILQITPESDEAYLEIPDELQEYLTLDGYTIKPEVFQGKISRKATRVTAIKRLARKIVGYNDGLITIVTTNLPEIATRIASSPFSPYYKTFQTQVDQTPGTNFNDFVHGTRLVQAYGQYLPILENTGILKYQKLERTKQLDRIHTTLLSSGDTTTDALMMAQAIKNGGRAIMVGVDPEQTSRMFHDELKPILSKEELNKLLFAEQNNYYTI